MQAQYDYLLTNKMIMKKLLSFAILFSVFALGASAKKVKTDYRNALILAYSQANSVYEDDNIKLEIYNEQLWATNKTNKTIFIDLAQCFAFHNGASMPLFDSSEKKQGDTKASKKGVSTKDDTYITIAPAIGAKQSETFICNMSTRIYGKYTTSETPSTDFTEYDKKLLGMLGGMLEESKRSDPKGKEYIGTVVRHMTEDESINNLGASVAYAFNKKAENWNNVSLSTWVSDAIFAPFYVEMPAELKKKEMKGFGIKETSPAVIHIRANSPFEFEEDRSPIIVCDWEGNYKKGTFQLGSTWIAKKKGVNVFHILGAMLTAGYNLLLRSWTETTYKKIIHFDGADAEWGKMNYVNDIMDTKQDD